MVYQDWDALKMEYVTTKTTYAKLAEKYGISISQIKIVAARDGWTMSGKSSLHAYNKRRTGRRVTARPTGSRV